MALATLFYMSVARLSTISPPILNLLTTITNYIRTHVCDELRCLLAPVRGALYIQQVAAYAVFKHQIQPCKVNM
jgi:hypothetical protein